MIFPCKNTLCVSIPLSLLFFVLAVPPAWLEDWGKGEKPRQLKPKGAWTCPPQPFYCAWEGETSSCSGLIDTHRAAADVTKRHRATSRNTTSNRKMQHWLKERKLAVEGLEAFFIVVLLSDKPRVERKSLWYFLLIKLFSTRWYFHWWAHEARNAGHSCSRPC